MRQVSHHVSLLLGPLSTIAATTPPPKSAVPCARLAGPARLTARASIVGGIAELRVVKSRLGVVESGRAWDRLGNVPSRQAAILI